MLDSVLPSLQSRQMPDLCFARCELVPIVQEPEAQPEAVPAPAVARNIDVQHASDASDTNTASSQLGDGLNPPADPHPDPEHVQPGALDDIEAQDADPDDLADILAMEKGSKALAEAKPTGADTNLLMAKADRRAVKRAAKLAAARAAPSSSLLPVPEEGSSPSSSGSEGSSEGSAGDCRHLGGRPAAFRQTEYSVSKTLPCL